MCAFYFSWPTTVPPNRDDLDISLKSQSCKPNVTCKPRVYSKERFSSRSTLGPKLMEYYSSCSSSQSFYRGCFLESPWALRHIVSEWVKLLSHVRLCVTPWTVAHQAPPSMGFSRQEYWSGVPLPSPTRWAVYCKTQEQPHGRDAQGKVWGRGVELPGPLPSPWISMCLPKPVLWGFYGNCLTVGTVD